MLEVKDLSVSYANEKILDHVSFSLGNGTITALLGANGCGKTTLLKALCCLIPHEGTCVLEGRALEMCSVKERAKAVSYIPQRSGIAIDLTALEVVFMGFNPQLKLLQQPTATMVDKARQTLYNMGIEADQNYLTLSEGQKQLCILARTMVSDGKLLLLDEPESALDLQNRYEIFDRLRVWMGERAILAALHDPQLALQTADKLILLKNKAVYAVLSPRSDSLETMEQALCGIYGAVRLHEIDGTIVMIKARK